MASASYLQVRTDSNDKAQASAILEGLGTNLSTVVNMLLKQIILTRSIPFDIKLSEPVFTPEEMIGEVQATMAMEGLPLDGEDIAMLKQYQLASPTEQEAIRSELIHAYSEA